MARKKAYNKEEVIDKAMYLFWQKGYSNTSIQELEKGMGINMFSIYSSFGNKEGVFKECLKAYKAKTNYIFSNFENSEDGVEDIKKLFRSLFSVWYSNGKQNGCLITNTINEFPNSDDDFILKEVKNRKNFKQHIIKKLETDHTKSKATILSEANFLVLSLHALATISRINTKQEIEDFINMVFKTI
ncbi:TetR family transcriptional regulator [Salegentibacter salinarum]|uniref:TetR family transcriptional regulator n=1 Tax=Salegentibacter salinarum TaxID=447422 RepID=A0A2N0U1R0_9FLAO|nr:TetR/AcrR family transcriptional regulator [Salegentibacter salinarum]PKD20846.1 TetR family transcriptional regulator [Salegentibacter salinarum]SKB78584.1 transcriptional regulator, TetR family [Salegentibacter salinarum]